MAGADSIMVLRHGCLSLAGVFFRPEQLDVGEKVIEDRAHEEHIFCELGFMELAFFHS